MLNPFVLLTPSLLNAMTTQPMYFVRQYYDRGINEFDNKIPLLFSHYSHHEIDEERAQRHMRLLKTDKYRFLYDSSNKEDLNKLMIAALQPSGYKIYTNLLLREWTPPKYIKIRVYFYLKEKLCIGSNLWNETIKIQLQDLFGQLYLRISWRGTKVEVLLNEIENIYEHVL